MNQTVEAIAGIVAGLIGVAIVAVLVSKNAQTGTVISNAGTALSSVITAATAPVTQASGSNTFGG